MLASSGPKNEYIVESARCRLKVSHLVPMAPNRGAVGPPVLADCFSPALVQPLLKGASRRTLRYFDSLAAIGDPVGFFF